MLYIYIYICLHYSQCFSSRTFSIGATSPSSIGITPPSLLGATSPSLLGATPPFLFCVTPLFLLGATPPPYHCMITNLCLLVRFSVTSYLESVTLLSLLYTQYNHLLLTVLKVLLFVYLYREFVPNLIESFAISIRCIYLYNCWCFISNLINPQPTSKSIVTH